MWNFSCFTHVAINTGTKINDVMAVDHEGFIFSLDSILQLGFHIQVIIWWLEGKQELSSKIGEVLWSWIQTSMATPGDSLPRTERMQFFFACPPIITCYIFVAKEPVDSVFMTLSSEYGWFSFLPISPNCLNWCFTSYAY